MEQPMSETLDLPVIDEALIDKKPVAAAAALVVQATQLDLAKLDLTDVALAQFGDWRKDIEAAEKRHKGIAWDLSTGKGMADIKSFRQRECNTPQAEANKVGDALVSKLTQVSKKVRAEQAEKVTAYKELAAPLTLLIDARQAEIDAEEIRKAEEAKKAEDERKAGQQALLDGFDRWIERCQTEGMTPERIGLGIVALTDTPIGAEFDADYRSAAEARKLLTLARMLNIRGELTAALQGEAQRQLDEQAAELARQQAEIKAREEAAALAIQQEIEAAQARAAAQAAAEAASHAAGPAAGEVENPGTCAEATQVIYEGHAAPDQRCDEACMHVCTEGGAVPPKCANTIPEAEAAPGMGTLASLRGMPPGATGDESSVEFVARVRAEGWGEPLATSFDGPDDSDDEGGIDVAPMAAVAPTRVILLEPDDAPDPDQLITDYRELVRLVRSGLGEVPAGWWQALREHCDAAAPRLDAYLGKEA
jgi:hypothetical protein